MYVCTVQCGHGPCCEFSLSCSVPSWQAGEVEEVEEVEEVGSEAQWGRMR